MNRLGVLFFTLGLLTCLSMSAQTDWSSEQTITLKRNQVQTFNLLVGPNDTRELKFHWTLFIDGGLVFLTKYDLFNHQTILREGYKKNAMRIPLGQSMSRGKLPPYLVVFFQEYSKQNETATFKVVIYGDVFVQ